jgi:hypothetical protein
MIEGKLRSAFPIGGNLFKSYAYFTSLSSSASSVPDGSMA